MTDETTTEQVPEQNDDQFVKCPCCGEKTLRKPLDIKSEVLDEYMASIITGVPFAHTYTLHDSIDVTVEVPHKRDAQTVYSAIKVLDKMRDKLERDGKQEQADDIQGAMLLLQTYSNITSIVTWKDKKVVKTYHPSEVTKQLLSVIHDAGTPELIIETLKDVDKPDLVSTIPDMMLRAIVNTHSDVYKILLNTGFNENFWKGIELV